MNLEKTKYPKRLAQQRWEHTRHSGEWSGEKGSGDEVKNVSSPYGFVPRFHVLRLRTMTGMPPDWQLEKCNIDRGHISHLDINFIYFHKLIVVPAFF